MNFHPRHGTIIPITKKEKDALIAKWGITESKQSNPIIPGFHAANYKKKAAEISNNHFRISRLLGYAAYYMQKPDMGKEAWNDLLRWGKNKTLPPLKTSRILPPEVPAPIDEIPFVSTNDVAT